MKEFNDSDLKDIEERGIPKELLMEQIQTFKEGIPFVQLEKAAVVGDGILRFSDEEESALIQYFQKHSKDLTLLKFVPASGAASRMFKALFGFLERYDPEKEALDAYLKRTDDQDMRKFAKNIQDFPFYRIVQSRIAGQTSSKDKEVYLFVKELLSEDALNYGFYPKGLLPFHNYGDHVATPFEEHLKEAALYSRTGDSANLHFTISEQHGELFNHEFAQVKERVSKATKTSFRVGYSTQKPATDTIAVDMENNPFREDDGSLLFRPGGHGALIENLNEQDADIIFIKNIDNVVVPESLQEVSDYKRLLAGVLLQIQEKAFAYARLLEENSLEGEQLSEIRDFLERSLNVRFPDNFTTFSIGEQIKILKDKIYRPIRICGMVKNEGEPGGGPFWVRDGSGRVSLQIVESAQVDLSNPGQEKIFKDATHFNPVDLVCGVRDYKGGKYNLLNYVDRKQGFITGKTKAGRELKALELPGLWNGAMAFWNTIFVEVPLITFNPVKTVNDLLKRSHQVKP